MRDLRSAISLRAVVKIRKAAVRSFATAAMKFFQC
jgi:hypothetical protein